jgi:hypothetical protein
MTYGHAESDLPSFTRSTNFSDYGYIFAEMIKSGVSFRDLGLDRYLLENNKNTSKESGHAWGAAAIQSGLLNTEKVLEAAVRGKIKDRMDAQARKWALMDINLGDGKNWTADARKIAVLLGLLDEHDVRPRAPPPAVAPAEYRGETYGERFYGIDRDEAAAALARWRALDAAPPPPPGFYDPRPWTAENTARAADPSYGQQGGSRRKSLRKKRGRKARRTRRH